MAGLNCYIPLQNVDMSPVESCSSGNPKFPLGLTVRIPVLANSSMHGLAGARTCISCISAGKRQRQHLAEQHRHHVMTFKVCHILCRKLTYAYRQAGFAFTECMQQLIIQHHISELVEMQELPEGLTYAQHMTKCSPSCRSADKLPLRAPRQ